MQVAMIAQGEFMELLRAKSDTKKVIFRKLFGTEIFQKIVDELGERKKKKEKEIATIRTVFQTEAAHLRIPEGYERAEELAAFKRRITTAARLSVTDMEELLQELDVLCGALETGERLAYEEYQKASEFRDKKRDAYAGAEHLLKFFRQLEEAEADLAVCQEAEASMKRAKALIGKLRAAYEIRAEFQRYEDARKAEADMRTRRKEQQELLPELERAAGEAKEKEAEKKKLFEQELESFSRILERVEKARKLFDTIRDAQRETVQREKTFRKAESIAEEKRKRLSDLEEQEKVWRRQCDELGDAEKRLALWKVKRMEAEALEKEAREERNQQMEVDGQRRSAKKAKEDYAAASQAYEKISGMRRCEKIFWICRQVFWQESFVREFPVRSVVPWNIRRPASGRTKRRRFPGKRSTYWERKPEGCEAYRKSGRQQRRRSRRFLARRRKFWNICRQGIWNIWQGACPMFQKR